MSRAPVVSCRAACRRVFPGEIGCGGYLDFFQPESGVVAVHDVVPKVDDVGLQGEVRHPAAAAALRVDDTVGAGPDQLGFGGVVSGAADDDQVGTQRPRGQGDIDVVGVGVERGHERARFRQAGPVQYGVVGDIADDGQVRQISNPVRVPVDDDYLLDGGDEVVADTAANPSPPADDDVPRGPGQLAAHFPPFEVTSEMALDERFEDYAEGVKGDSHACQDQDHREGLTDGVEWVDLAEPDGAHRGDGLVHSIDEAEAERIVADAPGDQHKR